MNELGKAEFEAENPRLVEVNPQGLLFYLYKEVEKIAQLTLECKPTSMEDYVYFKAAVVKRASSTNTAWSREQAYNANFYFNCSLLIDTLHRLATTKAHGVDFFGLCHGLAPILNLCGEVNNEIVYARLDVEVILNPSKTTPSITTTHTMDIK